MFFLRERTPVSKLQIILFYIKTAEKTESLKSVCGRSEATGEFSCPDAERDHLILS